MTFNPASITPEHAAERLAARYRDGVGRAPDIDADETPEPGRDGRLLEAAFGLWEHINIGSTLTDDSRSQLMASAAFKDFSRIVRTLIPLEERMDLRGNEERDAGMRWLTNPEDGSYAY